MVIGLWQNFFANQHFVLIAIYFCGALENKDINALLVKRPCTKNAMKSYWENVQDQVLTQKAQLCCGKDSK